MKKDFSRTILFTFLLFVSLQTFAQEKSISVKFDEFTISSSERVKEENYFKRFAAQLKKMPQTMGVIIRYAPRIQSHSATNYWNSDAYLLSAQRRLEAEDISETRIKKIDGGIREKETFEFWIVSKNTPLPIPKPEYNLNDVVKCPNIIQIQGEEYSLQRDKPHYFTARVFPPLTEISYEWKVSTGEIVEGQGAEKIQVEIGASQEKRLVVVLKVKGLDLECDNTARTTTLFKTAPFRFAEFRDYSEYILLYLDKTSIYLEKEPSSNAQIYVYAPSKRRALEKVREFQNYLALRNYYNKERIKVDIGGYREENFFEVWVYSKEDAPPKPTEDDNFVIFTKKTKNKENGKRN